MAPGAPAGERAIDISLLISELTTLNNGQAEPIAAPTVQPTGLNMSLCSEPSFLTGEFPVSLRAQNRLWKRYRGALRKLDHGAANEKALCQSIRRYFEVVDDVEL